MFKLFLNSKETDKPIQLKRARRSRSFSLFFSDQILLLNCHRSSTVRERLLFLSRLAREPFWHCDHSEQREPTDSELTQHASLISWQRRSIAIWQLKATRPSSQSSRMSATTSLDQSCPMTQHSLLCFYSSPPQEASLAEHELIHSGHIGQPCLHMSPNSGDWRPRDLASPSAAKRCRPISATATRSKPPAPS